MIIFSNSFAILLVTDIPLLLSSSFYLDDLYLCSLKLLSCTRLLYPLIVVFVGNNPLVKLQLLISYILKIHFLLCVCLQFCYYTVNLKLSSPHSVVLVDCIHTFMKYTFLLYMGFIFYVVGPLFFLC